MIVDVLLAGVSPIVGILLHLSQMVRSVYSAGQGAEEIFLGLIKGGGFSFSFWNLQDRRFYILEGVGCVPATYWDTYGLIAMALVPVGIALAAGTYTSTLEKKTFPFRFSFLMANLSTVMALVNIWLRRQKMMSMIASGASVNKDQFLRLFVLALAEYGTCL
jgi:hypothetical protein